MSEEKLAAALNQMSEFTLDRLEAIAKARNAPIERRVAAILTVVAFSGLPIATATTEMICSLNDPEWEHVGEKNPTDTHVGRLIVSMVHSHPQETRTVAEKLAAKLIRLADDSSAISDEAMDFILRCLTGQDGGWWIDWIREHRTR